MKKLLLTTLLFVGVLGATQAQVFEKGSKNINIGGSLGYGSGLLFSGEYGVNDVLGVGLNFGTSSKSISVSSVSTKSKYTSFGLRAAIHLNKIMGKSMNYDQNKIDPYIGLAPSFYSVKVSASSGANNASDNVTTKYLGGFAGVRYHFSRNLGVYAELGFPYNSVGISLKF